jgi:hypothetical protein
VRIAYPDDEDEALGQRCGGERLKKVGTIRRGSGENVTMKRKGSESRGGGGRAMCARWG